MPLAALSPSELDQVLDAWMNNSWLTAWFAPIIDVQQFPNGPQRKLALLRLRQFQERTRNNWRPAKVDWDAFLSRQIAQTSDARKRSAYTEMLTEFRRLTAFQATVAGPPLMELTYSAISPQPIRDPNPSKEEIQVHFPSLVECLRAHDDVHVLTRSLIQRWDVPQIASYLNAFLSRDGAKHNNWGQQSYVKVRVVVFALRQRLCEAGWAPRWQPRPDAAGTHLSALLELDDQYVDLYWLSLRWPGHVADNGAWRPLFELPFDMDTAHRVVKRRQGRHAKVRDLLLSESQQASCRYFCAKATNQKLSQAERLVFTEEKRQQEQQASSHNHRPTNDEIQHRLQVYRCGILTAWSPQCMASMYRAMTGCEASRQRMQNFKKSFGPRRKREFRIFL